MTRPAVIEFREVEAPRAGEGEVLVRVKRIGVCGSDVHVYHGLHPYTGYPVVQGHEVSGEIVEVGRGVSRFAPGEAVTFLPQLTCGRCYMCTHGMSNVCSSLKVMGFQAPGAAQELFAVPEELVVKLPAGISYEIGAMVEPISVGVHALRRAGEILGKKVLVLGAGTIGNLVSQVARALGADAVMITDVSDVRLEVARRCGARFPVNTAKSDLAGAIEEHFGEAKADVVLECVGAQATITQAVANARKGTRVVVVGVFGRKPEVDLGLVQDRELSLVGTLMYQKGDFETAVRLIEEGRLKLEGLITDRFRFEDYPKAYELIEREKERVLKVMIALD